MPSGTVGDVLGCFVVGLDEGDVLGEVVGVYHMGINEGTETVEY